MHTGQMMLVVGAFVMLSILSLSFNGTMLSSLVQGLEMEATLNALSLGQSMLDEILSRNFDERSVNAKLYKPADATLESSFGPDGAGESITGVDTTYLSRSKFDDVDDYHLYRRNVWDSRLGWFSVTDTVRYVWEDNPNAPSGTRTFFKVVTVAVTHPNLPRTMDEANTVIPIVLRDISIYRRYF